MHTHLSRYMRYNLYSILKFYAEHSIRKALDDCSVLLYCGLFCHTLVKITFYCFYFFE